MGSSLGHAPVARGFSSCGSVAVAQGLSCSAACGILVPGPEIEPASPALQGGFLTTDFLTREVPIDNW